jgi:hypothetical protein
MLALIIPSADHDNLANLHAGFLAILPRIELHGRVYFRYLRCPVQREECIAEMVALSWKWYLRLQQRGKDPSQFVSAIATFAARAVNTGRRLGHQLPARDALSAVAQERHGFNVTALATCSTLTGNLLSDALRDNRHTPPDEQAAFRIDFAAWLRRLSLRDRRLVTDMAQGERTLDLARKFGMSPAAVSQRRRLFEADWNRFTADPAEIQPHPARTAVNHPRITSGGQTRGLHALP